MPFPDRNKMSQFVSDYVMDEVERHPGTEVTKEDMKSFIQNGIEAFDSLELHDKEVREAKIEYCDQHEKTRIRIDKSGNRYCMACRRLGIKSKVS